MENEILLCLPKMFKLIHFPWISTVGINSVCRSLVLRGLKQINKFPLSCKFCFPKHVCSEWYVTTVDRYKDAGLCFNIYSFTVSI